MRRAQVARLLREYGLVDHGVCARIARELGVSRATICRDRQALMRDSRGTRTHGYGRHG